MENKRRYGRAWKRIRDKYVKAHPNCAICGAETEEVHHIKPLSQGGSLNDRSNLMALCRRCHLKVHEAITDFMEGADVH